MADNHNQLLKDLIGTISKDNITGETIKEIEKSNLWKELLEFMKQEGQTYWVTILFFRVILKIIPYLNLSMLLLIWIAMNRLPAHLILKQYLII